MSDRVAADKGVVVACGNCGKKNRIPFRRMREVAACGNCGTAVEALGAPIDIADPQGFDQLIAESPLPVLVDFWAEWCGPCRMVAPEIAKVAAQEKSSIVVAKVNTERLPALSARFSVQSIPMMAVFASGREAARTMGARPAPGIVQFVREAVAREAKPAV